MSKGISSRLNRRAWLALQLQDRRRKRVAAHGGLSSLYSGLRHWFAMDEEDTGGRYDSVSDAWLDSNGSVDFVASYNGSNAASLYYSYLSDLYGGGYFGQWDGGSFSVQAWIRLDDETAGDQFFFGIWSEADTTACKWRLQYRHLQSLVFSVATDDLGGAWEVQDNDFSEGQWVHVVGVFDYDAGEVRFYKNNSLVGVDYPGTNILNMANIGGMMVGIENANQLQLFGAVDDLGFWNRAITPSEVAALYNGWHP